MRTRRHSIAGLVVVLVGTMALIAGCGDSGGRSGAAGATGTAGTTPPMNSVLGISEDLPGVVVAITSVTGGSNADGTFKAGDKVTVKFTIKKSNGDNYALSDLTVAKVMLAGPTFNYQRLISWDYGLKTGATQNTDGSYTYTTASAIPATYPAPANNSDSFGSDAGELRGQSLLAGTYTVAIAAYKDFTVEGVTYRDPGFDSKETLFLGATTIESRQVVKIENCNQCHGKLRAHYNRHYGNDTRGCVLCHASGAEDGNVASVEGGTPGVTIDFRVMIHKIHNGVHLPSVQGVATNADGSRNYAATATPYKIVGHDEEVFDYSAVAFPVWPNLTYAMPKDLGYSALTSAQKTQEDNIRKGVTDCDKCHGDPDGTGPLTAPSQGNLAYAQPTRRACGSCHDDINWSYPYVANGQTMPAQANDATCTGCHATSGNALAVQDAHKHPIDNTATNSGVTFNVTSVTGNSGATFFQAGDKPTVTFTVKDRNGTDVPLGSLDAASMLVVGPTSSYQFVMPFAGTSPAVSPFDFSGRLSTSSTSNKAAMSKVYPTGTTVTEILTTSFTSATAFTVTGSVSGALGGSALAASPSTNPSGSSLSAIVLSTSAVAQTVEVNFTSATAFTVTGSVSGAMGSGTLPASTSGSMRFTSTDGTVAFTMTVGTTAFAAGNKIYATIFKGAAANPVLFAIVAGRTSVAATDRIYYEYIKPATSYSYVVPMEIAFEYLGNGNGAVGQVLTAGNLPVYYGRQTLYEATAVTARTLLTAVCNPLDRYVDVASTTGFAANDYCVLEGAAGLGDREYLQVGYVESATRMWFTTPIRYAHAVGDACDEPTLTFRQEGAGNRYTLNAANGTVTSVTAFGNGNGMVMSYRTDGAFGYYRHRNDARQTVYVPPLNDSPDLAQAWGDWKGLAYQNGTYTAGIWGSVNLDVAAQNEVQTYRGTADTSFKNFLYGAAGTVTTRELISSQDNCNACHNSVLMHGGSRRGFNNCVLCHAVSGSEDKSRYNRTTADATPNVTIDFRTMLHKIHMGEELTNAATYAVAGHSSSSYYDEVVFPMMPDSPLSKKKWGTTKYCAACHGATNTAWKEPADRNHAAQTVPTRTWNAVCTSCHDSDTAAAHANTQTSGGIEACGACHGSGGTYRVEWMHKIR